MVSFPPYLASAGWYGRWLRSTLSSGATFSAISEANLHLHDNRELARTSILTPEGNMLTLSVAMEGGGRKLRSLRHDALFPLSEHGNWRKNHVMAIESAYGKKPFFLFAAPSLHDVIADRRITDLNHLSCSLHYSITTLLLGNLNIDDLHEISRSHMLSQRSKEIAKEIKEDISVIDAIMNLGPEAILGIFALYNI